MTTAAIVIGAALTWLQWRVSTAKQSPKRSRDLYRVRPMLCAVWIAVFSLPFGNNSHLSNLTISCRPFIIAESR